MKGITNLDNISQSVIDDFLKVIPNMTSIEKQCIYSQNGFLVFYSGKAPQWKTFKICGINFKYQGDNISKKPLLNGRYYVPGKNLTIEDLNKL